MDIYLSGGDKVPEETIASRLKKLEGCTGDKWYNERFRILNDIILTPSLVDVTNQTGLIHRTCFSWHQDRFGQATQIYCVSLWRHRPKTGGFWNGWARFFSPEQRALRINFNGQLWCCYYDISSYYMAAQQYRDAYYEKLKVGFGGNDFVIASNDE